MAIDKAVDSAVLDAGLTAIANAIREKTGGTDALAFPDGLVAAIAGIETGGSIEVEEGSFTLTESTDDYTVYFSKQYSDCPTILFCWLEATTSETMQYFTSAIRAKVSYFNGSYDSNGIGEGYSLLYGKVGATYALPRFVDGFTRNDWRKGRDSLAINSHGLGDQARLLKGTYRWVCLWL